MIPLLTTTVLSLSLRSLVCYQTNSTSCGTPSGSRKYFSDIRRQEYYHLFRQRSRELRVAATHARTHATFGQCERLANVLPTNYFRRTDENPLQWTYHYAQSFFLAPKMITIIKKICSQNKAKNAGRSRKEKCGNAGNTSKCGISRTIAGWLTPMNCHHVLQ